MDRTGARRDTRRMKSQPSQPEAGESDSAATRKRSRVSDLQTMIDERDETIRMLNEALSQALDELRSSRRAA